MTLLQSILLSIFILVSIYVTYSSQRKLILIMRQRDKLSKALISLLEKLSLESSKATDITELQKIVAEVFHPEIKK